MFRSARDIIALVQARISKFNHIYSFQFSVYYSSHPYLIENCSPWKCSWSYCLNIALNYSPANKWKNVVSIKKCSGDIKYYTLNRQLMLTAENITNYISSCIFFPFSLICDLWFIQLALSCVQGVTVHGNVCWHLYVQSLHAPKMFYREKNTYPNSCELYYYRISEQYNLTYVLYQFTI